MEKKEDINVYYPKLDYTPSLSIWQPPSDATVRKFLDNTHNTELKCLYSDYKLMYKHNNGTNENAARIHTFYRDVFRKELVRRGLLDGGILEIE